MSDRPDGASVFLGACLGALALLLIFAICGELDPCLSDKTMNTICQKLDTNNTNVNVHAYADQKGKLVCEYPSYDNTPNIIIKSNSETVERR